MSDLVGNPEDQFSQNEARITFFNLGACLSFPELEDVDLPSCSQIVSKGLPILNQTGLLVKKNKPQHQVSSRFSSRAASLTGK